MSLLLVGLVLALTAGPAPSYAARDRDPHSVRTKGVLAFVKDRDAQFRSRLVLRVWRHDARERDHWRLVSRHSWRAGSGLPGRGGRDGCASSRGWLPNGRYRVWQKDDHGGDYIRGRVFYLGDHACRDGTVRRQLFLHTEQDVGSRQCRNRKGDQVCRWEYPRINDYKSNGCIKVSPRSLRQLTRVFHRHFSGGRWLPSSVFSLRVRG